MNAVVLRRRVDQAGQVRDLPDPDPHMHSAIRRSRRLRQILEVDEGTCPRFFVGQRAAAGRLHVRGSLLVTPSEVGRVDAVVAMAHLPDAVSSVAPDPSPSTATRTTPEDPTPLHGGPKVDQSRWAPKAPDPNGPHQPRSTTRTPPTSGVSPTRPAGSLTAPTAG